MCNLNMIVNSEASRNFSKQMQSLEVCLFANCFLNSRLQCSIGDETWWHNNEPALWNVREHFFRHPSIIHAIGWMKWYSQLSWNMMRSQVTLQFDIFEISSIPLEITTSAFPKALFLHASISGPGNLNVTRCYFPLPFLPTLKIWSRAHWGKRN